MNEDPLIKRLDEMERTYAPQQVPEERDRVLADEGTDAVDVPTLQEPPAPAPVATVGTSPSGVAAPPNIGHEEHGGAPGDPNTEARNPLDTDESLEERRR